MRRLAVPLFLAALLTPTLSLAEGASPAEWSLGGGLSWTLVGNPISAILLPSGAYVTSIDASIPSVNASLERRAGERTWIVLGLAGGGDRREMDPPSGSTYSPTDQTVTGAFASVGVRRVLTPGDAPVDFSIVGAIEGGFVRASETTPSPAGGDLEETYRSRLVGVSGGIALDRTLTGSLSLRIATPLVTASYASVSSTATGQADRDGSALGAHVVLAPRLELRIAF
ncbi:hypothetical protein [Anaeromyxobacter sp. SG64]|uniref:hypothetical protein n=1 Tax=Anaeromyxobacter sp. SG64 TaxID=2925409 RepID=UPI001F59C45B|nr:hypothetical protein [Anaeromyxobacter sp. SG64]